MRGDGQRLVISVTDESGKVDLNAADERLLQALLAGAGVPSSRAVTEAIMDFRDNDNIRRPQGAETEEYAAAKRVGPKNAPFSVIEEIEQVLGVDSEIARHLRPHLTVYSGAPGIDTASASRELREIEGCTILVYDQTCATEKRRRRKRGKMVDPTRRVVINELVCEGCGDCSVQSNCLSVEPVETEFGRKRRINQNTCNKDYSCLKGFCPSFVTVEGGQLKKPKKEAQRTDPYTLPEIPERLLVIGGGYIGLELGTVYATLGSRVTLVEMTDGLLPGVDRDLVQPLQRRVEKLFAAVHLRTKVTALREAGGRIEATLEGQGGESFDRVLVAVGRTARSAGLGLETTGVRLTERGLQLLVLLGKRTLTLARLQRPTRYQSGLAALQELALPGRDRLLTRLATTSSLRDRHLTADDCEDEPVLLFNRKPRRTGHATLPSQGARH